MREAALLARVLENVSIGTCLDVPCGAGRLAGFVEARGGTWSGCDLSASMLFEAKDAGAPRLLRARADTLPFRDASFETVLCFRFLHHLEAVHQQTLARELGRVAHSRVVLSGFAPWSFHGAKRNVSLSITGRPRKRFPSRVSELDGIFAQLGFSRSRYAREGFGRELWLACWERD